MIEPTRTVSTYEDLTVSIDRVEGIGSGHRRQWLLAVPESSRFNQDFTPRPFTIPVTPEEIERALGDVSSASRPWVQRSGPGLALDPVKEIGARLFTTLLEAGLDSVYRLTRGTGSGSADGSQPLMFVKTVSTGTGDGSVEETGFRLRLQFDDPELEAIPWELLFDVVRQDFLVLVRRVSVVRQWGTRPAEDLAPVIDPPLRVLIVNAEITDTGAAEEIAAVRALASDPSLVEIEELPGATRSRLVETLRERQFHVVHFIGTGLASEFETGPSRQMLVLPADADEGGEPWTAIATRQLSTILAEQRDLQLVYLSACHTDRVASELSKAVPAVIGMRGAVSVEACQNLTEGLYRAMLAGQPLDAAMAYARQTIDLRQPGGREWGRTLLYMRTLEGARVAQAPPGPFGATRRHPPDEDRVPSSVEPIAQRPWSRLQQLLDIQQHNLDALEERSKQAPIVSKFLQLQIDETTARIDELRRALTGIDGEQRCDGLKVTP